MNTATVHGPVVIGVDPIAGGVTAHHRDFPEIRARGRDPVDAATQLARQLMRALDTALTAWRRDTIQGAITDVERFAAAQS
ncbi:MAG: hypothetical protein KatS3mg108_3871 [Isosphaeraceae bacterium]|jgi:hypothetical protein|nr:MAG: hypothetical protein KatS3mg108_3871 [Isosphaeraceae bacterium]